MKLTQRIRLNSKVEIVDDERNIGNGIIVQLKKGWSWDQLCDNRVAGEDTPSKMIDALKSRTHKFSGPFTD